MGAWGMDDYGKNARNLMIQMANQGVGRAGDNRFRADQQYNQGNFTVEDSKNRLKQLADAGYITPAQAMQYANEALGPQSEGPWGGMSSREDALDQQRGGMTNAGQAMGDVRAAQQGQRNVIDQTSGDVSNQIKGYDTLADQAAGVYGGMRGSAGRVYGNLRGVGAGAMGGLLDQNKANTADLLGRGDTAIAQQAARVNARMDPKNASIAQAYAPQMAAAQRGLRAANVDPNSAEGQERTQRVYDSMSRNFDANLADNIDRQNQLTQQGFNQRADLTKWGQGQNQALTQAQLANDQGLAQADLSTDLGLQQQSLANNQNLKLQGMGANIENARYGGQQMLDWYNQQAQNPLLARQMQQQDYGLAQGAADRRNQIAQSQYADKANRAGLGMQFGDKDLAAKQWATGGLLNAGTGQMQQAGNWENLGQNAQNMAMQGNQSLYNQAAQNAGWGWQMLGQGAGAALGMF